MEDGPWPGPAPKGEASAAAVLASLDRGEGEMAQLRRVNGHLKHALQRLSVKLGAEQVEADKQIKLYRRALATGGEVISMPPCLFCTEHC